jgi:Xaa-Pro aminopeptidase
VTFEGSLSYASWKKWAAALSEWEWVEGPDLIRPLRMIKTEDEVTRIRAACELADACLSHVQRLLQPGISEYDIALDIEFFFRRQGAECSFPSIVASGPNGAKPHAKPSERLLATGDFVTLDLGCLLDGYCSDITRTFAIGTVDERQQEVYDQVLLAQTEACKKLIPGTPAKEVDLFSREILAQKDLAQFFGHSLGHGLGRAVHDFGSLSSRSEDVMAVGQVWTVEPGVYIDGWGGLRIEDDVLVTETGPEILTHFPKDLILT